MKYKYFVMLVLLTGFSFLRLSSGNKKTIVIDTACKTACGKCKKIAKPVKEDNSIFQFSPLNHFLNFI
ncbi:MAG: hypothetical protein ABUT20_19495 [Bacteroidota bacterium]